MYTLQVKHFFDAAHQLKDTPELVTKQCANLHGHTYAVIAEIKSKDDNVNSAGMVIDFKAVKQVIDKFDHRYINEVLPEIGFEDVQPTAENIAYVIAEELMELGVEVKKVSVCEGYKGVERSSWVVYEPSN